MACVLRLHVCSNVAEHKRWFCSQVAACGGARAPRKLRLCRRGNDMVQHVPIVVKCMACVLRLRAGSSVAEHRRWFCDQLAPCGGARAPNTSASDHMCLQSVRELAALPNQCIASCYGFVDRRHVFQTHERNCARRFTLRFWLQRRVTRALITTTIACATNQNLYASL